MSAPSPSIFRNLERTAGREGYDTIVRAAVAAYAPLYRPTQRQCRDFGNLVMPLFDRADRDTRRMLAASLATASKLPRALIERLLREPIEIAAPFLLGSPLLTENDLDSLRRRSDPSLDRLLSARRPVGAPVPKAAAETEAAVQEGYAPSPEAPSLVQGGSERQTSLLSMGGAASSASADNEPTPEPFDTAAGIAPAGGADEVRLALRRLATVGRRPAEARPAPANVDAPALLDFAIRRDIEGFRAALAAKLLVSPEEATALASNGEGKPLAEALKALGTSLADAMTILMMTSPRIGADVAAFDAMQAHYEALDADRCAARFDLLGVPASASARHAPQYAPAPAASPRRAGGPTFGRRKPVAIELSGNRRSR